MASKKAPFFNYVMTCVDRDLNAEEVSEIIAYT